MRKIIGFALLFASISLSLKAEEMELPSHKELAHFHFYCAQEDQEVADLIAQRVEGRFVELCDRYHYDPNALIAFYIYPSTQAFHDAIEWSDAPEGVIGSWKIGQIQMVSPNASNTVHSFDSRFLYTPITDLVSVMLQTSYSSAPHWFRLGLACYESGRYIEEGETRKAGCLIMQAFIEKRGDFPVFEDLEDFSTFRQMKLHPYATILVAYIVKNWGFDVILPFLEDFSRFEEILGKTKADFREEWTEFLKKDFF